MKTDIQTVNFDASPGLVSFIHAELEGLGTYYNRIVGAEVYLREDTGDSNHKEVKLKLNVPGPDLFAEDQASSFEAGLAEVVEKMKRQLKKKNGRKR
ncbi:MAG: HPF/RaiA family ribosome-associated protein [Cyclobacteriaceae bacterium]